MQQQSVQGLGPVAQDMKEPNVENPISLFRGSNESSQRQTISDLSALARGEYVPKVEGPWTTDTEKKLYVALIKQLLENTPHKDFAKVVRPIEGTWRDYHLGQQPPGRDGEYQIH